MAKNIEIQYQNGTQYEIMYPKTLSTQVIMADLTNLEDTVTSLKTSVSNGKSQIASAITDKGVSTSATADFSTMANNINKIQVGVNTDDATATPDTILKGYTAYVKGQKITGTKVVYNYNGTPVQNLTSFNFNNTGGSYPNYRNANTSISANELFRYVYSESSISYFGININGSVFNIIMYMYNRNTGTTTAYSIFQTKNVGFQISRVVIESITLPTTLNQYAQGTYGKVGATLYPNSALSGTYVNEAYITEQFSVSGSIIQDF